MTTVGPDDMAVAEYHAAQQAPPVTLFKSDDPGEIVERASAIATKLADVIDRQGLASNIQGRKYVRVEGWTLLGSMLGVFPICVWSRELEGGWEARVEARTLTGAIVGAAEASCTRSERNWRDRDDFALRSMAQTRATAKALRLPLGFVMTLAGFEATPEEEMPTEPPPHRAPPQAPRQETLLVSEKQANRLRAIAFQRGEHLGVSRDVVQKKVKEILKAHGFDSSRMVTVEQYDAICDEIEKAEWNG